MVQRDRKENQAILQMLLDQEDLLAQWDPQESKEHVARKDLRERREILAQEGEMASLVHLETQDPLDPLGHQDLMDLEETLLLRWLVVLMRRQEVFRWV